MLSYKVNCAMSDLLEEAEKQEQLILQKEQDIQDIVGECEKALKNPNLVNSILKNIIEEHKQAI
ncbi:hypothetical protein FDF74_04730 [Clostridium niameyense]|uniref:Uncharacterized protein n=1 Tax=Clostridium niameyense TaxID=1622073 RepID=A0A6M0RA25_9CLOT|nr:hypothetical protein [Clostridium niameyense]NEZ46520.1 hypothetical protein [Clostridium niameyense]